MTELRVFSIFNSISSEVGSFHQGSFTTFIRLANCNRRCSYCDFTSVTKIGAGHTVDLNTVLEEVRKHRCYQVIITGGEPLMQKLGVKILTKELRDSGYFVQIETNGTIPMDFRADCWVVGYKLPGADTLEGMSVDEIMQYICDSDWLKFVCTNRNDYNLAHEVINRLQRAEKTTIPQLALSGVQPQLPHDLLLKWMQEDGLRGVVLNVQLHKLINLKEDI